MTDLKIGLLGGTGKMGQGLSLRWAKKHDVLIGSRTLDKAMVIAQKCEKRARAHYHTTMLGSIRGLLNADAIKGSEVVVVTFPPESLVPSIRALKKDLCSKRVVVSTVVPMVKERGLFCCRALLPTEAVGGAGQSAAEILQTIVQPAVVASAFHTVPAAHLQNIESVLDIDVLIASDDASATAIVTQLVADIPNLRPLNVGRLENSKCIESITPLLLNAALLNHLREPSIRIVPWMPTSYTH